jgi:hypothetical protein
MLLSVFTHNLGDNMSSFNITDFISKSNKDTSVDNLTKTAESAFAWLLLNGISNLNLSGLIPEEVNAEHLALLLRITSTYKDSIEGWTDALEVAHTAATLASLDPTDVLYGLM